MRESKHKADLDRNNTTLTRLGEAYQFHYHDYTIRLNSVSINFGRSSDLAVVALECNTRLMTTMAFSHRDPSSRIEAMQYSCPANPPSKNLVLQAQRDTGPFRFSYLDASEMLAGLYVGARFFGDRLPDLDIEFYRGSSFRAVATGIWTYNRALASPGTQ